MSIYVAVALSLSPYIYIVYAYAYIYNYICMYVWICDEWVSCFHLLPQVTHWDEHAIYCSAQKWIWVKNQLPTVTGIQEEGRSVLLPCYTHLAIFTGPRGTACVTCVPQNVQVPFDQHPTYIYISKYTCIMPCVIYI